jgi:4,4'-diaponeurosporenoate glycosyltransferase
MIAPLLCTLGIPAAFLLIGRIRSCPPAHAIAAPPLSIIIPARNEERNLPRLLTSLASSSLKPAQVLVVDDGSTDNTASVARSLGAVVLRSMPLPKGWTGKTWACYQGAQHATGELLLFLDADTWFVLGGLEGLIASWAKMQDPAVVLSLLPWHEMSAGAEQLSLFFNFLMASAGFAAFAQPRLFGQSLLITRELYVASRGHASVRGLVLENLGLAGSLRKAGARLICLSGAGTFHMRMFPEGFHQMFTGWTKGFAQGAAHSERIAIAASAVWISALWSTVSLLLVPFNSVHAGPLAVYLLLGVQLAWLSRRLGNFHPLVSLLYPVPLLYFCVVFGVSATRSALGRKTRWRGRDV